MLSGDAAVQQAPMLDGFAFDPFSVFDDGRGPSEVGVGWCHIVEAFVIAPMVVVLDEGLDLAFEITGQEVIFEQDAVLERLMPSLDLALCLGMHGGAANMVHAIGMDVIRQILSDVTGPIVAQQARTMQHMGLIAA
jgi:hypothetical protein